MGFLKKRRAIVLHRKLLLVETPAPVRYSAVLSRGQLAERLTIGLLSIHLIPSFLWCADFLNGFNTPVLTTLRIKNLALVPDLTLELAPGYNAVTGETGAGKSVIIGALNLYIDFINMFLFLLRFMGDRRYA